MNTTIKNENGMTMIEIVIAMVLMAFILTSASVFVNSTNSTKAKLNNVSEATQIGNDMVESLRTMDYDSLNNIGENSAALNDTYKCSWSVQDSISYKIVKVTVAWPLNNPSHDINLETIIAK